MTSRIPFRTPILLRISLVAAVVALGACNEARGGGEATEPEPRSEVTIEGLVYRPGEVTVEAGETVTWVNRDEVDHTVTSGKPGRQGVPGVSEGTAPKVDGMFDEPLERQGSTFAFTFEEPGTYVYFCRVHAAMKAVVVVE